MTQREKITKAWAVINTLNKEFENFCTIEIDEYCEELATGLCLGIFLKKETAKEFRDFIGESVVKVVPCEIKLTSKK